MTVSKAADSGSSSSSAAATSSSSSSWSSADAAAPALALAGTSSSERRRGRCLLDLPAGYHFKPTDDELVVHFLRRKIAGLPPLLPIFIEATSFRISPDDLVEKYRGYDSEGKFFFFTRRKRKYGARPERSTGNGGWRATGSQRVIQTAAGEVVGCVRTLVFYAKHETSSKGGKGVNKGINTDWTMYEYENESVASKSTDKLDEWVLCTIQKKHNCGEGVRKGDKRNRKAPSSNGGNDPSAADVEEVEEQEEGKKKKLNSPEESPKGQQNAVVDLPTTTSPPPPQLPYSLFLEDEGTDLMMEPQDSYYMLPFMNPIDETMPMMPAPEMMGMTTAGHNSNFDPNNPMLTTQINSTASLQSPSLQSDELMRYQQEVGAATTFFTPPVMPLSWAEPYFDGDGNYYVGATDADANMMGVGQNSVGDYPVIGPRFSREELLSFLPHYDAAAPCESAQASTSHHPQHGFIHNAPVMGSYSTSYDYANEAISTNQEGLSAGPPPLFSAGANGDGGGEPGFSSELHMIVAGVRSPPLFNAGANGDGGGGPGFSSELDMVVAGVRSSPLFNAGPNGDGDDGGGPEFRSELDMMFGRVRSLGA
ncbi:hypothetical protein ABZP36_018055 [Zizania latifolia]